MFKITMHVQVNQLLTPNKSSRALSLCTSSQVQTKQIMEKVTGNWEGSVQVVDKIYILAVLEIPNSLR